MSARIRAAVSASVLPGCMSNIRLLKKLPKRNQSSRRGRGASTLRLARFQRFNLLRQLAYHFLALIELLFELGDARLVIFGSVSGGREPETRRKRYAQPGAGARGRRVSCGTHCSCPLYVNYRPPTVSLETTTPRWSKRTTRPSWMTC